MERLATPTIDFRKTRLSNGLDVITRPIHDLPVVSINLWYHVGSKNEERRQRGFAHLFEHLMFEGSAHYPGDFFASLERFGASINGSTSSDRTNYYIDLPSAHLELALAIESDRMGFLRPALTDEKLRIQKSVVENEYRQNYANRPYGQAWRLLAEATYPQHHPYNWLPIGFMEDLAAATRIDVEAFHERFYTPSNSSLAIVGHFDEEHALGLVEKYFGSIPRGPHIAQPNPAPPSLAGPIHLAFYEDVELDRVYKSWPTVPQFHDHDAALVLAADIVGRGRSSRLYRKLILESAIAQDVAISQNSRELAGSLSVVVTLRPRNSCRDVAQRIDAEWAELAADGPRPNELARVQTGRIAGFIYALERAGGFGGVADRLNAYNTYRADPSLITSDVARFESVTADDVRAAAARYLAGKPAVELSILSQRSKPKPALSVDRVIQPNSQAPIAYHAPVPERLSLADGTELWFVRTRALPIVAMTFALRAGASAHSAREGGLANLTAELMMEGTATRTNIAIAEEVERLASGLSSTCGWDGSYVTLHALTSNWCETLELASDVIRNPSFPIAEFDRVHTQSLLDLKSQRDRPEALAYRAFLKNTFGNSNPFHLPIDGSLESVADLGRDNIREFHQNIYNSSKSAWIVAGNLEPDAIVNSLNSLLSLVPGAKARPLQADSCLPRSATRPRLLFVNRPGATQANIRVGQIGIARANPNYENLMIWNYVLGGKFSSRLNRRLREEKGYTYGIRSQFESRRSPGPFSISAAVDASRVGDALHDLSEEVESLLSDQPVTSSELDDARRAVIEGQAQQFDTSSALVSRFAALFVQDLPVDEYARLPERLADATIDSITRAALESINPKTWVYVVVADEAVLPQLDRLSLAEIEPLSVDQVI
jgi:zinc protease